MKAEIINVVGIPKTASVGQHIDFTFDLHNAGPEDAGVAAEVWVNGTMHQGYYRGIPPIPYCQSYNLNQGAIPIIFSGQALKIEIVAYILSGDWVETDRVKYTVNIKFPWLALVSMGAGIIPAFRRKNEA